MFTCIVVEFLTKYVTIIDGKDVGISRHIDYSLFHYKARDVNALKVPISKFIFVNMKGDVEEVVQAEQLKERGVNYKTAKRDEVSTLTDVEFAEVRGAIALARAAMVVGLKPKPEADTKPPVPHIPADGVPKVIITAEAAAAGLGELLAQADSKPADNSEAREGGAAADAAVVTVPDADAGTEVETEVVADIEGEGARAEAQGDEGAAAADTPADDALATGKPSRKKRRR